MSLIIVEELYSILPQILKATISLFVVIDPIGNIPLFIGLTEKLSQEERRRIFHMASWVAFLLLITFALAGQQVLLIFGVKLYSLMMAGGILLLIIAVRILLSGGWHEKSDGPEDMGVVPIAFPLLVGPGAMTTTLVTLQADGAFVSLLAVLINFAIIWLVLRFIEPIYKILGRTGSQVIARIMAVFIAALAIELIFEGYLNFQSLFKT
ncbi:MAG: MarC family protein [Candidatus Bathyarchaeia archaeon]